MTAIRLQGEPKGSSRRQTGRAHDILGGRREFTSSTPKPTLNRGFQLRVWRASAMPTNVFLSISVLGVLLNTQALAQASASDPEIDYCVSQQIAEGVEPLTENRLLVAEAVNAYLRKAQFTQEDAEQLCRVSNDSERIYITYMETRDMIRVGPLADDASIHVAGTMVQLESCWFLLMDSGVFPLQLDPLPRTFMRVGQRVELTLSGPMVGCGTECTYPIVGPWKSWA